MTCEDECDPIRRPPTALRCLRPSRRPPMALPLPHCRHRPMATMEATLHCVASKRRAHSHHLCTALGSAAHGTSLHTLQPLSTHRQRSWWVAVLQELTERAHHDTDARALYR